MVMVATIFSKTPITMVTECQTIWTNALMELNIGLNSRQITMAMDAAIRQHGLQISGRGTFGGSSYWMRAEDDVDMGQATRDLREAGVLIEPGAPFFMGPDRPRNFYRLAYSSIPTGRIADGIATLAQVVSGQNETGSKRR